MRVSAPAVAPEPRMRSDDTRLHLKKHLRIVELATRPTQDSADGNIGKRSATYIAKDPGLKAGSIALPSACTSEVMGDLGGDFGRKRHG